MKSNIHPQNIGLSKNHVVISVFIGLIIFLALGFLAGGPRSPGEAPEINFSEANGEIVLDSIQQLQYRDHTVVSYDARRNGSLVENVVSNFRIEHSKERIRAENIVVGEADRNTSTAWFINRYNMWIKPPRGNWQQAHVDMDRFYEYGEMRGVLLTSSIRNASAIIAGNWTVEVETDRYLRLRSTDEEALSMFHTGTFEPGGPIYVTIAKGEDPHLTRIAAPANTPNSSALRVDSFQKFGNTTASRPSELPSLTIREISNRIIIGHKRLLPDEFV